MLQRYGISHNVPNNFSTIIKSIHVATFQSTIVCPIYISYFLPSFHFPDYISTLEESISNPVHESYPTDIFTIAKPLGFQTNDITDYAGTKCCSFNQSPLNQSDVVSAFNVTNIIQAFNVTNNIPSISHSSDFHANNSAYYKKPDYRVSHEKETSNKSAHIQAHI